MDLDFHPHAVLDRAGADHHHRHPAGRRQRGGDRPGLPQAAGGPASKGIIWGTAGAIVLRVVLIIFAMTLLNLPFLKVVVRCCWWDWREAAGAR